MSQAGADHEVKHSPIVPEVVATVEAVGANVGHDPGDPSRGAAKLRFGMSERGLRDVRDGEVFVAHVGIAPSDAMSAATIRTRVLRNHLGTPLGSSTLRRSLAALLLGDLRMESLYTRG